MKPDVVASFLDERLGAALVAAFVYGSVAAGRAGPTSDHGPFLSGIGDYTERIRTGRVLPARPSPSDAEIPEGLRLLCRALGYL